MLSALALLLIVVGTVWWLPPIATVVLAEIALLLAFAEYASLTRQAGVAFLRVPAAAAALATCAAVSLAPAVLPVVIMAATVTVAVTHLAEGRQQHTVSEVAAAAFAFLYLGVPLGALAALRLHDGREVVLLFLATIVVSDTAQYYGGRLLGRRLLAPTVSPKKTVEGALFGLVAGMIVVLVVGRYWLPALTPIPRVALGATIASLGIIGDLFESQLKRASGAKDASSLIPGHGGLLDRIDGMIFATPIYYAVVRFVT